MRVWVVSVALAGGLLLTSCGNPARAAFEKAASELPAAEAEARRLGIPLSGADLMPNPPVPREDNAAPLLRAASQQFRTAASKSRGWEVEMGRALADPTPAQLVSAQNTLQPLDDALDQAVLASTKPRVDFGRNWKSDEVRDLTFPELSDGKNLVKGLVQRAQLRAHQGDTQGATQDFRAAITIGRYMNTEPTMIGALVRVAIDALVVRGMEYALTARPTDAAFAAELDALAATQLDHPVELLESLRGEIIFGLAAANMPVDKLLPMATGAVDPADIEALRNQAQVRGRLAPRGVPEDIRQRAYRARALQPWIEIYADKEAQRDNRTLLNRMAEIEKMRELDRDPTLAMHQLFSTSYAAMGNSILMGQARWHVVRGLMAVLRFKAAKGRYPASLAEAGFNESDPFTGKPLRLKVEGETVRVYSVGPDGVDNGGEERVNTAPDSPRQMDIVSMFPRRVNPAPK